MNEHTAGYDAACVCPPDFCLGADSDTGTTVECAACFALDPDLPCLRDPVRLAPHYDRDGGNLDRTVFPDDYDPEVPPPVGCVGRADGGRRHSFIHGGVCISCGTCVLPPAE